MERQPPLSQPADRPILFFDGVCNLCNGAIQYVIRHDRQKRFLFAPLQSTAGKKATSRIPGLAPDSLILFYRGRCYTKSSAVLHTARLLGGFIAAFYVFIIVPRFLRDAVYNLIARHRYKWFGRRSECMVPTPELQGRFLN